MEKYSYGKVFAALDGSSAQEEVACKAVAIASHNHAALCFGHVVDSVPVEATGVDVESLCSSVKARIEEELSEVIALAKADENIPSFEFVIDAGQITETLHHRLIDACRPDLVICGERGLSSVAYVFVGSVSTYLIRNLRCDVLVVKQG